MIVKERLIGRLAHLPEIPEKKKQVLLCLAWNGKNNIYAISKKCKMGYSTTHASIKVLQKEGLVKLEALRKNEKMVSATEYSLTTKGVERVLIELPNWDEKIAIVEKWQRILNPNALEWMKFIGVLNDKKAKEIINAHITGSLQCSEDLGFFTAAIDEPFFDATISTMIVLPESEENLRSKIDTFPRIKKRLLKMLNEDIAWREEDLKRYKLIKYRLEQSSN